MNKASSPRRARSLARPTEPNNRLAPLLALSLLTAIFLLFGLMQSARADDERPRELSLSASGSVRASPDMATISIGVISRAVAASEALEDNEAAMRRILRGLRDSEIKPDDIGTSQFSVSPIYERSRKRPARPDITGYQVSNIVTVIVRDLDDLGRILDQVIKLGSNRINNIQFGYSNLDELLDRARRRAVRTARKRADLYAEAAGVRLGPIVKISEGGTNMPRPTNLMRAGRAAMAAESVSIAAGKRKLSASVNISWQIEE